jgi:hypothetical protein
MHHSKANRNIISYISPFSHPRKHLSADVLTRHATPPLDRQTYSYRYLS